VLTRFIKIQLVLFTILTIIAIVVLGWYYLRVPSLVGIGTYDLHANLPRSGGLYATSNVTYRGTQIGKVEIHVPCTSMLRKNAFYKAVRGPDHSSRRRSFTRWAGAAANRTPRRLRSREAADLIPTNRSSA